MKYKSDVKYLFKSMSSKSESFTKNGRSDFFNVNDYLIKLYRTFFTDFLFKVR
jgi:hypothetical protein